MLAAERETDSPIAGTRLLTFGFARCCSDKEPEDEPDTPGGLDDRGKAWGRSFCKTATAALLTAGMG